MRRPRLSLQARLLLLVGSLIALTLLSSLALVYHDISQQIASSARDSLDVAQATLRSRLANNRNLLEIAAAALEDEPGFRNVLRTHDQATAQDYLAQVLDSFRVELVVVTDPQGRVQVATQHLPEVRAWLAQCLAGETSEGTWLLDSGLYQVASIPMTEAGDRLSGTLTVGLRLDERLCRPLAQDTGCQVVLWSQERTLAATLPLKQLSEGSTSLAGTVYQTAISPIGPQARLGFLRDTREAEERLHSLAAWLSLLGAAALSLALVVSAPLLHHIANPVERVLRAEARLAAVFSANSDGLVAMDGEGRVTLANPAAARALGRESEHLHLEELLDEETAAQLLGDPEGRLTQRARLEREGHQFVLTRSFLGRESPGSLLVIREVTSEEEGERRMAAFFRSFADSLAALKKNPRLLANLAVLAECWGVELAPIELGELLDGLLDWPGREATRSAWSVGELPSVLAHAPSLRLVLDNLLDNAWQYGASPIELGCRQAGGAVEFWVGDGGSGFLETRRQEILQRSYPKQGLHTTQEGSGPGLGLYVAATLVEAMRGRLHYEALEPGSRFSFWLPVAD